MYNLELEKAVEEINKKKAKTILVQLADGLKPRAKEVQDFLEKKTKKNIIIWGGSCFGACDIPTDAKNFGVDLVLQWGHCL